MPTVARFSRAILARPYLRRFMVASWYAIGVLLCFYLAFWLRFEGRISHTYMGMFWTAFPLLFGVRMLTFYGFGLFRGIWRYLAFHDAVRSVAAALVSTLVFALLLYISKGLTFAPFPRSVLVIDLLLCVAYCIGGRVILRLIRETSAIEQVHDSSADSRALVVGDLLHTNRFLRSVSDIPTIKRSILGVVVPRGEFQHATELQGIALAGSADQVGAAASAHNANTLIVVSPFTEAGELRKLSDSCVQAGVRARLRMVPPAADFVHGPSPSLIRDVNISDLLGRPTVEFDHNEVRHFVQGQRILITGAGGSIGRELVRQTLAYTPQRVVAVDNSELALFKLEQELGADARLRTMTVDIRFRDELNHAFQTHAIDLVYHAAAHKHVPLMEENEVAAFRTNVLGTATVSEAARAHGVRRMVMISSDKAVRPSSVMGATKRLAEQVLRDQPRSQTTFVSVRFGNVLGSSGSVVPTFQKQIAAGGPVTVTTADTTRYFMTVSEAVDLVLQAGVVGEDRDIMVLEMGQPVRIVELARQLIELSGLIPDVDIPIVFTGLRPGEKEHEELLTASEDVVQRCARKIWRIQRQEESDSVPLQQIQQLTASSNAAELRRLAATLIADHRLSLAEMDRRSACKSDSG